MVISALMLLTEAVVWLASAAKLLSVWLSPENGRWIVTTGATFIFISSAAAVT